MKWNEIVGILGIALLTVGIILILSWFISLIVKSVILFLTSNFIYNSFLIIVGLVSTAIGFEIVRRS